MESASNAVATGGWRGGALESSATAGDAIMELVTVSEERRDCASKMRQSGKIIAQALILGNNSEFRRSAEKATIKSEPGAQNNGRHTSARRVV